MKLSDLTNSQKRRDFLEDYTGWDFLLDVPIVSEKYYSYPLPDNTIIVAKETEHTKGDDWWKKDERGGYYVTTEYYLLEGDWKRFADCKKSKTQIIEHLREIKIREDVAKLLEELKSYKDLEEQGLLVRVPCKVGDPVFFIVGKDISKQRIREMKISDNGLGIIFKAKRRIFNANCVGKDVFLTKEDANQKLDRSKENDIQH